MLQLEEDLGELSRCLLDSEVPHHLLSAVPGELKPPRLVRYKAFERGSKGAYIPFLH